VTPRPAPATALVLAAGLGARLRPLTANRAKPSLPVAGPSLIARVVTWLASRGIPDLIVNLHYRPETITAILGDGAPFGVRVRYSWEQPLLGSAGGPRRAFALGADDRLWLVNGDTLCDVALEAMADAHGRSDALVTMAVIPNPDPTRYGGVLVDEGMVTGFTRRGSGPSWHFVGVQIAERRAFESLTDGVPYESVSALYPALMATHPGSVRAFQTEARFHDIGTSSDYLAACLELADDPAALVAPDARVHAGARLDRTVVWDDVEIGAGARLREAIVMSGARVPAHFIAERQIVAPDLTLTPID
jgi:NDP-sugar pyrophosphorylase family protein